MSAPSNTPGSSRILCTASADWEGGAPSRAASASYLPNNAAT